MKCTYSFYKRNIRIIILGVTAAVSLIISAKSFFPGIICDDAVSQLNEATRGFFNGWHPPAYGLLYKVLGGESTGRAFIFILQNIFYWFGFFIYGYLLSKQCFLLGLITILLGFFPAFHVLSIVLIKDSWMTSCLIVASALLFYILETTKPRFIIKIISFLAAIIGFIGICVRHNGALSLFPLIYMGTIIWNKQKHLKFTQKKITLLSIFIYSFFCFVPYQANRYFTKKDSHPEQYLYFMDLIALSSIKRTLFIDETFFNKPENLLNEIDNARLKDNYDIFYIDQLWFSHNNSPPILQMLHDEKKIKELQILWAKSISTHPLIYFQYRFQQLLYGATLKLFIFSPETIALHFPANLNPKSQYFMPEIASIWKYLAHYIPCSLVWLLGINAIILIFSLFKKKYKDNFWICGTSVSLSGWLYFFTYLILLPIGRQWYFHWCWASLSFGSLVLISSILYPKNKKQNSTLKPTSYMT